MTPDKFDEMQAAWERDIRRKYKRRERRLANLIVLAKVLAIVAVGFVAGILFAVNC